MTDPLDAMRAQLDAIWERSRKDIEGRVEAIESAALGLLDNSLSREEREDTCRQAHKLAGVAGTFGFPHATALAHEAESILMADHVVTPADVVRLSAIANELRHDLIEVGRTSDTSAAVAAPVENAATRVVMVDDDVTVIALVTALLANHGIAVSGTSKPADMWQVLEKQPPDLILLDVDMPETTGIELCRQIRADHRYDSIPVVFLTSRTAAAVDLFEAGADNYLTKPVNGTELLAVLRSRVRRTRSVLAVEPRKSGPMPAVTSVPEYNCDVVIVDDDKLLVDLLCHTVTARGYSARSMGDGTTAMTSLAGPNPPVRARVIVLDVGLPEHDGLAVLRALTRDGITRHTRVIMLTARSLESEVLQALDMGAYDHVGKPFSIPVLMHRIRRALDDRPTG